MDKIFKFNIFRNCKLSKYQVGYNTLIQVRCSKTF